MADRRADGRAGTARLPPLSFHSRAVQNSHLLHHHTGLQTPVTECTRCCSRKRAPPFKAIQNHMNPISLPGLAPSNPHHLPTPPPPPSRALHGCYNSSNGGDSGNRPTSAVAATPHGNNSSTIYHATGRTTCCAANDCSFLMRQHLLQLRDVHLALGRSGRLATLRPRRCLPLQQLQSLHGMTQSLQHHA